MAKEELLAGFMILLSLKCKAYDGDGLTTCVRAVEGTALPRAGADLY